MNRKSKYLPITITIITLFLSQNAQALNYKSFIGTSLVYTKLTNSSPVSEYEQIKNPELLSVNYGQAFFNKDFLIKIGTNRLYNQEQKRQYIVDGKQILNKSKVTTDYIVAERLINNYGVGFFVANAKLEQENYYYNKLLDKSKNYDIIYGLSFSSFLNEKISLSVNYMLESKEFGFSAYILAINYSF